MRKLGVHTSIAGGIHLSLKRAKDLGCTTVQIFSHSPRTWLFQHIDAESVREFKRLKRVYEISPVFIHTSYLINLASVDDEVRRKSMLMLIREMDAADSLDADYVVLHTGSASRDSKDIARRRAISALRETIKHRKWKTRLLLENTAGERGDISSRIIDLAEIIDESGGDMGVCLDTCHAFAAGYAISDKNGLSEFVHEIETHIGISTVRLIHLNDSRRGLDSRVDRHEHIGQGGIGREGLRRFINHPAFKGVPLILETPKRSEEDDPRNLSVVREIIKP